MLIYLNTIHRDYSSPFTSHFQHVFPFNLQITFNSNVCQVILYTCKLVKMMFKYAAYKKLNFWADGTSKIQKTEGPERSKVKRCK